MAKKLEQTINVLKRANDGSEIEEELAKVNNQLR